MEFISYAQLAKDVDTFCKQLPKPDLIVGIPRSGMLPATMMAKYWDVPLTTSKSDDYESKVYENVDSKLMISIYVVDDSMLCGQTMLDMMKYSREDKRIKYLVIYDSADYHHRDGMLPYTSFRAIKGGRVFQWNLWNHKEVLASCCMDIDGVLCRPPTEEENDDGPLYKKFLGETEQWYKPQHQVGVLVTARIGKYQKDTIEWLNRNDIKFDNLAMLNMKSKVERLSYQNVHAKFKARVYAKTHTLLFIEDDPGQAYAINQLTNRPVLCVSNWKLYNWGDKNG